MLCKGLCQVVPRQLIDAQKKARLEACLELLNCHLSDETFLKRIAIEDETWIITTSLKEAIVRQQFITDEQVKLTVKKWLKLKSRE